MGRLEERLEEYNNLFDKSLAYRDNTELFEKLEKMYAELRKDLDDIAGLYIGVKYYAEDVLLHRV